MKSRWILFAAGLFALALSSNVYAHSFGLTLGNDAGANHYFGVICSSESGADTDRLLLRVRTDTVGGPLVSAQVRKGEVVTNTTDATNGDADYSPTSRTPGGNGLYHVTINKTGAGRIDFTLDVHCMNKSEDVHTGTDGLVYQYQFQ